MQRIVVVIVLVFLFGCNRKDNVNYKKYLDCQIEKGKLIDQIKALELENARLHELLDKCDNYINNIEK